MSNSQLEVPGSERAVLRASVTAIDGLIAQLSKALTADEYRTLADQLLGAWPELVKRLALGQPPELRECPRCQQLGMRAATRCGYCWIELSSAS